MISDEQQAQSYKSTNNSKKLAAAIACGFPISYSSCWDINHTFVRVRDTELATNSPGSWSSKQNTVGEWCQVCLINERVVREIEMAGRNSDKHPQFVKSFIIKYTLDGIDWISYNGGEALQGPKDYKDIVRHKLEPFRAVAVRIYPQTYHQHMSCRWELYYERQ